MAVPFKEKYGSYAIVTGASSGIGEAFAHQIAARGLNLVLVSRRLDRLQVIASTLQQEFHIDVQCLALDLSSPGAADKLAHETASLQIGLLVLNAAVMQAGGFLKGSFDRESHLVTLNTLVPTQIAHRIGNRMKQQQRGGILFISSLSALGPGPYQATYAASKAYLSSLGGALSYELSSHNIDVSVLWPGMTETEGLRSMPNLDLSKLKGISLMSAAEVANAGLEGLGNKVNIIPGAANKLSFFLSRLIPPTLSSKLLVKMTIKAINKDTL